ncbi:probable AMP deaminase [Rosa rugosa]|uniref:probable AMP deaminase n=1 Tax=Rosa rugosa TaxID=74645 RepID=UPI002B414757|nr:probable AMP deaminase [Rosa rugosa]
MMKTCHCYFPFSLFPVQSYNKNKCEGKRVAETLMFDYHRQHGIGRFLAELTKQVFSDLSASKYQMAEHRISKYGKKQSEWDQMASWIVNNELYSENVVWLIQVNARLPFRNRSYEFGGSSNNVRFRV